MSFEISVANHSVSVHLPSHLEGKFVCEVSGTAVEVDIRPGVAGEMVVRLDGGRQHECSVSRGGEEYKVTVSGETFTAAVLSDSRLPRASAGTAPKGNGIVRTPMPGRVVTILVQEGQTVQSGQGILVIEAMKMQNEIRASRSGTIRRIFVQEGQTVEANANLITIE